MLYAEVSYEELNKVKSSDTLIILGSGSSINDLDDTFWEFCDNNDTLAINHWIYHWYIPTFWSIESKGEKEHYDAWREQLDIHGRDKYKNTICIVPSISLSGVKKMLTAIDFCPKLYVFEIFRVSQEEWLQRLDTNDLITEDGKLIICTTMMISLMRNLLLAYKLGYKRIILAGVDLSNSLYFWSNMIDIKVHKRYNSYTNKEANMLDSEQALRRVHNSQSSKHKYPIALSIRDFNERTLKKQSVQLFTTSKKSLLYLKMNIDFFNWRKDG